MIFHEFFQEKRKKKGGKKGKEIQTQHTFTINNHSNSVEMVLIFNETG